MHFWNFNATHRDHAQFANPQYFYLYIDKTIYFYLFNFALFCSESTPVVFRNTPDFLPKVDTLYCSGDNIHVGVTFWSAACQANSLVLIISLFP